MFGLLPVLMGCLLSQTVDTQPSFEIASLKADKSTTGVDRIKRSPTSLLIENVSLKRLIGMAYGIAEGRDFLFSGPAWMDEQNFDISARFPQGVTEPESLRMLQRLAGGTRPAEVPSRIADVLRLCARNRQARIQTAADGGSRAI